MQAQEEASEASVGETGADPVSLVKEKHSPEPAKPGQDRREDYTYEKKGQRNLFIACEPLRASAISKSRLGAPRKTGPTSSKNS